MVAVPSAPVIGSSASLDFDCSTIMLFRDSERLEVDFANVTASMVAMAFGVSFLATPRVTEQLVLS